jgi:hypothetical protein
VSIDILTLVYSLYNLIFSAAIKNGSEKKKPKTNRGLARDPPSPLQHIPVQSYPESYEPSSYPHLNVVVGWLALLLRIREVPGLNLGPKTGFSELFVFSSVPPVKYRDGIVN